MRLAFTLQTSIAETYLNVSLDSPADEISLGGLLAFRVNH